MLIKQGAVHIGNHQANVLRISMLVQLAALTGVLSMFSLEYQIFQRLCDMWNQLLFKMLVATI